MTDNTEIAAIEGRMKHCSKRLHEMAASVGAAKQVRDYDSDRRKNLLARYVLPHLKAGASAAAGETEGRSDGRYQEELERLGEQYAEAGRVIARWEAEQASFEAARSLLSMAKETLKTLEG